MSNNLLLKVNIPNLNILNLNYTHRSNVTIDPGMTCTDFMRISVFVNNIRLQNNT